MSRAGECVGRVGEASFVCGIPSSPSLPPSFVLSSCSRLRFSLFLLWGPFRDDYSELRLPMTTNRSNPVETRGSVQNLDGVRAHLDVQYCAVSVRSLVAFNVTGWSQCHDLGFLDN